MNEETLQKKLLSWFARHGRDLPWRRTYDPYHIWLSEIMLQQTQMNRVIGYFERWLQRYPDIDALAAAQEEDVLKLWEGLGYYSRARNLLKTARLLATDFEGKLPADAHQLLQMPGIGRYTVGAILSLAFNQDQPVVDGNVERIFARLYDLDSPVKTKENHQFIWQQAERLLPAGKARWFNQALMELGALLCLPKNPRCRECPINDHCESLRLGITEERPVPGKGRTIIPIEVATGILTHQDKVFIQKRRATGVWANLWEFPGGQVEPGESPEEAVVREIYEETEFRVKRTEKITVVRHGYTNYRVTLHCFFCSLAPGATQPVLHAAQEYRWIDWDELARFAFPAGHRKLIDLLHGGKPQMAALG